MWNPNYRRLSKLRTRDDHVAELAWREGKLYFSRRRLGDKSAACDERAVEVATIEDAPEQETEILESAESDSLYIISGERTFRTRTAGQTWEEF